MDSCCKTLSLLLIVSVLAIGRVKALSFKDFAETIQLECFEGKNGNDWKPDSATSVENFIYMVEKIERTYPQGNAAELIKTLLSSFSCNRLEFDRYPVDRDDTAKQFELIMEEFLKDEPKVELPELTTEEKCQLFFMLSPIKTTVKEEQESGSKVKVHGYGLVSLNGDTKRAIDMSKVLYGIYAGLKNNPMKRIVDMKSNADVKNADKEVELLYASTISEVIHTAVKKEKELTDDNYGDSGIWTSSLCPKEYLYNNEETFNWPMTAEIIGAIDGFILGNEINKIDQKDGIKLSQILQMYYLNNGFYDGNQPHVSYCKRFNYIKDSENIKDLKEQSANYLAIYNEMKKDPVQEANIEKVGQFVNAFNSLNLGPTEGEIEDCLEENKGADVCDTPSNVFVVLDRKGDNITSQKLVVGKLINEMNIGLQEDTITIYLNSDIESLQNVVNASDSKAKASCVLEDLHPYSLPGRAEDSKVLTDIKNIMTVYEENQKSLHAVPSKVVVFFNLEETHEEDKRALEKARREMASRHRYLTIIPVGEDSNYLTQYFTNNQPSRLLSWHEDNLAPKLMEKICLAPAVLQHPNCKVKSKYADSAHTGYIRSFHVQHWAMYPQHFLKTFSYKFKFTAENGNIRVCFSRGGPISDSGDNKMCRTTSDQEHSVVFKDRDPCKGRTVHNCDPFYFSIFGREENSRCTQDFDDGSGCKRLHDIKYTIEHEDISCSRGENIISSPFLQMLLAFLVTSYILSQQK